MRADYAETPPAGQGRGHAQAVRQRTGGAHLGRDALTMFRYKASLWI